jgi:tetratricopeptide (TPR) repeat protein
MASKADLESREEQCNSVDDFVKLAQEALADPADKEYAKELLQKAEMQCQVPLDYLKPADVAVSELGDKEYATVLYEQAEDMLFEVPEFTAFAHSMAVHMTDQEKAREYLEKAADGASQVPDFLAIAKVARDDLGDEALAKSLLAKVEEKAKSLDDFCELAKKVVDSGDSETAQTFFKKAARFVDDIPSTVNYAKDIVGIFGDKAWARQTLEEAETDCQFTKEFVALAQGYKELFGDSDKVNELIDQAAEFCMSGEEHVDLADGYWNLLKDKDKAAESYEKALSEITDKQSLLDLAKKVAVELNHTNLAKTIYSKAEERMSSASELSKLAQAIVTDLKDKKYAAEVYARAAESLVNPNDLINLGSDIVAQLKDPKQATDVYRKAFDKAGDFKQLLNLVDHVDKDLGDKNFTQKILEKAVQTAQGTPDLVKIADKVLSALEDKSLAAHVLEEAEERVTSLGEMRAVTEAIETHFSDNSEWVARVDEKLAKREANQAKYEAFQKRENQAEAVLHYLKLAEAVMDELQDKFYARKLLVNAEQAYQAQGYDFNQGHELVIAINNHLNDQDWIKRILDDAARRCGNFACISAVGETASKDLSDKKAGRALAKNYYQSWEEKLDAAEAKSPYDYTKLASVIYHHLTDAAWASAILNKATAIGTDHFALAHIGQLALVIGDSDNAKTLYQKAVDACQTAAHLQQLARRLKANGVSSETIRELYMGAKPKFESAAEHLQWTEGITELFRDVEWATQEYEALASEFASGADVARFRASRQSHLRAGLY